VCYIPADLWIVNCSSFNETMVASVSTLAQGGKTQYFSVLKTELTCVLQEITIVGNGSLFLFPCNLRTYKNVLV